MQRLYAQDALPGCSRLQKATSDCGTLTIYGQRTDTLSAPIINLLPVFRQLGENELIGSADISKPFWEKVCMSRLGTSADTIYIVRAGDGHIHDHIFPQTTGEPPRETFGTPTYVGIGTNGAFCITFTRPVRVVDIAALHPDPVIPSFRINKSHSRRYDSKLHYQQIDELVRMLRDSLPDVPMLVVIPPGPYGNFHRRRRRRTYKINPHTSVAVQIIRRSADADGLAVWDIYDIFGGIHHACPNWQEAKLMCLDHVHYLPEGYVLQGEVLYQALLKAYNDYCNR